MDPLTLGAAAFVAALLLARKRPATAPPPPSSSTSTGGATSDPGSSIVDTLTTLVPGAAGALAFGAAGGAIGEKITGDKAGFVAGFINPIAGNAFNVGREVGEEIDVALGGDGDTGTGVVAQVGVGGALALAVILGPLFVLFALGYAVNLVIVYAVGSIISDTGRLAYGQKGARADFLKSWVAVHGKAYDGLRQKGLTDAQALRMSYPYADGYMRQMNRLAFKQWMKRGRGLLGLGTTTNSYHAVYGRDRGYFVGDVAGDQLSIEPDELSLSDPGYKSKAEFLPGDLTSTTRTDVVDYRTEWQDDPDAFKLSMGGMGFKALNGQVYETRCQLWKDQGKNDPKSLDYKLIYQPQCQVLVSIPIYETRTYVGDRKRLAYMAVGASHANAAAYVQWMASSRGAFVSDEKHAQYGIDEGRFEGSVVPGTNGAVDVQWAELNDDGTHRTETKRLDWKQPNGGVS